MKLFIVILAALVLNISGAFLSKLITISIHNYFIVLGLMVMLISVYLLRMKFWIYVSRLFQLSYIYPFLSINYVFSYLIGMYVFSESFSYHKLIGSIVIMAGVFILSGTSHKNETKP